MVRSSAEQVASQREEGASQALVDAQQEMQNAAGRAANLQLEIGRLSSELASVQEKQTAHAASDPVRI